jgi:hypothetical protein
MRRSTGIELGPDSCVMVAARRGRSATDVSVTHAIEPAAWPSHDVAVTSALKSARRANRLPRRAAVIVWGLPDDAATHEPSTRAAVRPVVAAGFSVRLVLTPPQALAALAATRPDPDPEAAVAWMALNTCGVALAIVRRGELLFSRSFEWAYRRGVESSRDQLLQRYALVAHLAPEVQRGIAAVQATWGVTVERAVTCGNLPELRSLTMPLIEELDLEVETLDSTEGLRPVGRARTDRLAESAPAIRLAAAAAVTPSPRGARWAPPVLRVAAAVLLVAGLGWLAYATYLAQRKEWAQERLPPVVSTGPDAPQAPVPSPVPAGQPGPAVATGPAPPDATVPASPPTGISPSVEAGPHGAPPVTPGTSPDRQPALPSVQTPPPAPPLPEPRRADPTQVAPPKPPPPARPAVPEPQRPEIEEVLPLPLPQPTRPAAGEPPPAPLEDPLPRIESILIHHTRRLAVVDGRIVAVGDTLGPRVVVRIEAEAIVLREPSGLDIRVPLRGRQDTGLQQSESRLHLALREDRRRRPQVFVPGTGRRGQP